MKDSLERLKRLQRQLETMHQSTTEVLKASQNLLRKIEAGEEAVPTVARRAGAKKQKAPKR